MFQFFASLFGPENETVDIDGVVSDARMAHYLKNVWLFPGERQIPVTVVNLDSGVATAFTVGDDWDEEKRLLTFAPLLGTPMQNRRVPQPNPEPLTAVAEAFYDAMVNRSR